MYIFYRWLRGCDPASLEEMHAMIRRQVDLKAMENTLPKTTFKEKISRPEFWKPLCIINLYFFTTQFSGVNAVAFYSVTIMKDTVGDGLNEYLAMMIIDTLRVFMSVVACILTRNYGRRPLTLVSGIGTAASLLALAANSHLAGHHAWFAMSALVGYITFVSIGLVPLPWAMTGEVFPLAVRGLASGATSSFAFVAFFLVVKTGPTLFSTIGSGGTFFFYGAIALAGTIILFFFLPETRNKTLQEIEDHFANGSKNNVEEPSKRKTDSIVA